jgi:dGTPase
MVKYPWFRKDGMKKFGWYRSARELVDWVWGSGLPSAVSTEARIMDVADDITYAAHDLADFIRARLIPFHCLTAACEERVAVLDGYRRENGEFDEKRLLQFLKDFDRIGGEYFGSWSQRARVRSFSSALIKYFRDSLRVKDLDGVIDISIDGPPKEHLSFLKFVSKYYVHNHRQVLMQRRGFRRIVSTLFEALLDEVGRGNFRMIGLDRERFECFTKAEVGSARLVSDFISSLGDEEAIKCYKRVAGVDCSTILGQSEG